MLEKIKNNKSKFTLIAVAIIIFMIGIIVIAMNHGNTYATSIYDYVCKPSDYEVLSYNDNYYCCPSDFEDIGNVMDENNHSHLSCKKNVIDSYSCQANGYNVKKNTGSTSFTCYIDAVNAIKMVDIIADAGDGHISYVDGVDNLGTNKKTYTQTCIPSSANTGCNVGAEVRAEREGYNFNGWGTSSDCVSGKQITEYKPLETTTYYACYEKSSDTDTETRYRVTYNANGGKFLDSFLNGYNYCDSNTVCHDMARPSYNGPYIVWYYNETELKKEGHTFEGWYDSNGNHWPEGQILWTRKEDVTLYAKWKATSEPGPITPTTYIVKYDANDGVGAPSEQIKTHRTALTLSATIPTRTGYTFVNWNTSKDGKGISYNPKTNYTDDVSVTLYAQWKNNEYKINYTLNGGAVIGNPTSGKYDQEIIINNPTKTIEIVVNGNNTGATIGKNISVTQNFAGWTSSDVDTKNAYHGNKIWSNGNTKVTDTNFKNLSIINDATVNLTANWSETSVTLPKVTNPGHTCNWNTKDDGKGISYKSEETLNDFTSDDITFNLYAICKVDKTDEEPPYSPPTGDVLITIVWIIGIGTLGYSVYYFVKRKNNI